MSGLTLAFSGAANGNQRTRLNCASRPPLQRLVRFLPYDYCMSNPVLHLENHALKFPLGVFSNSASSHLVALYKPLKMHAVPMNLPRRATSDRLPLASVFALNTGPVDRVSAFLKH